MLFRYFLDEKLKEYLKDNSEYQNLKDKFAPANEKLREHDGFYDKAYLIEADIFMSGGIEFYYRDESDFKKIENEIESSYQSIEYNKKFIEETQNTINELKAKKTFFKSTTKEKEDKIKTLEKLIYQKSLDNRDFEEQIEKDEEILENKEKYDEYISKEQIDFNELRKQRDNLLKEIKKIEVDNVVNVILKNLDSKEVNDVINEALKNKGEYDSDARYYNYAEPNGTIATAYRFIYNEAKMVLQKNQLALIQQFKDSVDIERV